MNQMFSVFKAISLRQILTAFLATIIFLAIPAFSYSSSIQAQAGTQIAEADSYTVDPATVKRIQNRAEDLGDRSEKRGGRAIGDTGLKNIKKLGENIPETLEMRARQDAKDAFGDERRNPLNEAGNRVKGAVDGAKRAVNNVVD